MANRVKEDDKNEKIIRGLMKLPANKRCINCNNLGPQYVCINFWTFICTNCSGIHREFTHRVKSISMAKFTTQEVIALQAGGNERAKEVYFKEWDPRRHSYPDSSNIDRLREFIKHVYVVRKYTGERSLHRPSTVKLERREDSSESKKAESYQSGSRSPPYAERYHERAGYFGRNVLRSPDTVEHKRSSSHFEVVDDRFREDRHRNGNQSRSFNGSRFPDGIPKLEGRSPNRKKQVDALNPAKAHPVKDIVGVNRPTLKVADPPKSNDISENSAQTQMASSSSGGGYSDTTSVQPKTPDSAILIDFSANPEPPVPTAREQSVPQQTKPAPSNGVDWASFDMAALTKAPQETSEVTALESSLGQLSASGSASGGNTLTLPVSSTDSFSQNDNSGPKFHQQQPSLLPSSHNQNANNPQSPPVVGAVNQPWGSPLAPNVQTTLTAPAGLPSQIAPRSSLEINVLQPPAEAKPSGRKALPEDLFASTYPPAPTSAPAWQRNPYFGMGMQYPTGMPTPTFHHPSQSSNPFDLTNEATPAQVPTLPSMASLQGSLPNVTGSSGLMRSSSFGNPSPRRISTQQLPYSSTASQSPYMMQQLASNMPQQIPSNIHPMLHQGVGRPGVEGAPFCTSGMDQPSSARYSHPGTPNSSGPAGGNPFG